jgi:hypothetical protein
MLACLASTLHSLNAAAQAQSLPALSEEEHRAAAASPSGTPASPSGTPADPPSSHEQEPAARGSFSFGRFVVESFSSAFVGSAAALLVYKVSCGDRNCLGGTVAGLGADIAVTPLAVWSVGGAMGGEGALGWTYVGGLAAFAGCGTKSDPTLPLVLGTILMPFTSSLLYELSSNANAKRAPGRGALLRPSIIPIYGQQGAVEGGGLMLSGRF